MTLLKLTFKEFLGIYQHIFEEYSVSCVQITKDGIDNYNWPKDEYYFIIMSYGALYLILFHYHVLRGPCTVLACILCLYIG
jgi:hypothetical protein